jgi:hypothetical protein
MKSANKVQQNGDQSEAFVESQAFVLFVRRGERIFMGVGVSLTTSDANLNLREPSTAEIAH